MLSIRAKSRRNRLRNTNKVQLAARCVVVLIFAVFAFMLIYPFFWAFLNSFKTYSDYFNNSFNLPPTWQFRNYVDVFSKIKVNATPFRQVGLGTMFANSLWLTLGGSLLTILSSTMIAYVVAKYRFRGRSLLYSLAIFVMIIPVVGNLPAQYKFYNDIGITNSPLFLVTYTGGFGFNFIVLYGFFKNVSWSYAEAAFVDGAKNFKVFAKIMLPLAMPAISAIFIIQVVALWNDYMTPLLYMTRYPTLASGLFRFKHIMELGENNYPVYFAGLFLATLPILLLFILFSETIMQNTVAGGLKG